MCSNWSDLFPSSPQETQNWPSLLGGYLRRILIQECASAIWEHMNVTSAKYDNMHDRKGHLYLVSISLKFWIAEENKLILFSSSNLLQGIFHTRGFQCEKLLFVLRGHTCHSSFASGTEVLMKMAHRWKLSAQLSVMWPLLHVLVSNACSLTVIKLKLHA